MNPLIVTEPNWKCVPESPDLTMPSVIAITALEYVTGNVTVDANFP